MAIDLISGAMAAVNQQTAKTSFLERTAAAKLGLAKPANFATALAGAAGRGGANAPDASAELAGNPSPDGKMKLRKQQAMLALEGTLMTKMADQMLPQDEHGLYGGGLAGSTWRSFEVENIGQTIAKSDLLHFNKTAAASRPGGLLTSGLAEPDTAIKITPFAG